ncbi:DUF6363 domain-containing protein [Moritella sp. 36]|uniref:DUF6363 domain-containing protein n=1 Tax=Moritella sp. 36 TaxID=2746233 RepID=UPI00210227F4|nr:DUF6363 domain-containing protein [Moritella sp. 36]
MQKRALIVEGGGMRGIFANAPQRSFNIITIITMATDKVFFNPIAYRETPCFSGGCYTDGGVADSIPVRKAYRLGARDITVLLSHPLSDKKQTTKYPWLVKTLFSQHPNIAKSTMVRASNYNESLEFIKNPPSDLNIRVIAPPSLPLNG